MSTTTAPPRSSPGTHREGRLRRTAAVTAALMAIVYTLIFTGLLSVGRASEGDLAILGVAGLVFAGLAGSLWWVRSRLLWVAAALLQVVLGWMYVVVSAERDPAFEVWGLTIRALSVVLLGVLIALLVDARRSR
jgi:hypothetical protein